MSVKQRLHALRECWLCSFDVPPCRHRRIIARPKGALGMHQNRPGVVGCSQLEGVRRCITVRVVNVFDIDMEEGPGRVGFWFRASGPLAGRLGAARIGAAVYEARAGVPIWPYHYHYPDEEWLYVLHGAPVLSDSGGRRVLDSGDVVCFPPGHRGAHTLEGPGTFVLFSGERSSGPFVSIYPDSDKVSVFPGIEAGGLNELRFVRAGSVDYWHAEGTGPVAPAAVTREPEAVPGPRVVNARDLVSDPGDGWRFAPLGEAVGGQSFDAAVVERRPEADCGPYRYEY